MQGNSVRYKVLIYGECNDYGSGAWCYYNTLKDMGHETEYYSQFKRLKKYSSILLFRIYKKITGGKVLFSDRKKHIADFIKQVDRFKPNIIIILKGLLIDGNTIDRLKQSAWVVMINHDDFFSQFKSSRSAIQFKAIPEYDYIFCTKEVNVQEIKAYNPNTEMLMFAHYPKIHHAPVYNEEDEKEWKSDVVFIGNCYPERAKQMEHLVGKVDINLKIYGPNWVKLIKNSPLHKYIQNQYLNPEEMARAIFYSSISLGFLCKENRDDYTQRTFEIPAMEGLLLAERTPRHQYLLEENKEAVFFESTNYDELVLKVKQLLTDEELRGDIKRNGQQRVLNDHHTYEDRLLRILKLYGHRKK